MKIEVLISILFLFILFTFIGNAQTQNQFEKNIEIKKPDNAKLEHILNKMATEPGNSNHLTREHNIDLRDNTVRVIIDLKEVNSQNLANLENSVSMIEISDKNLIQARVPISKLNIIANLPFVNYVSKPEKYKTFSINEGVATINATALHTSGFDGSGIKIAVLDGGFEGYSSKLGTELPSSVTVRSFRQDGDITGEREDHGTAVAQIVHDVTPGAQLYLVNYETDLELNNAVKWLIQQNVNIISHSRGKSIGPKDGTDYVDIIVNNATDAGILWVNAAGNEADEHWMENFSDPDNNKYQNFTSNDETQNIFAYQGMIIDVSLDWNDWPYSKQDYDLYLYDRSGNVVDYSMNYQTGTQQPFEIISYTATYTGNYYIIIKKFSSTRNVKFHLYSPYMEYIVPSGSIAIPGASTGSFTVGATHWLNHVLEPYSSQGPTEDGRTKPDIVAPDNITSSVYGTFPGTSASAPFVAGAAALLLQINPDQTVNQLKAAIEGGAKDLGAAGKDNQFGSGRIDVYNSAQPYLTLNVSVSESPDPIISGGTSRIDVQVTRGSMYVSGANVDISSTGGSLSQSSGVTNATGYFTSNFTAPDVTTNMTYMISARASKTGYVMNNSSDIMTVLSGHPGSLVSINITPSNATVMAGQTYNFTVNGYDSNGNSPAILPNWSSSNMTVGTVSSSGLFTAIKTGTTIITASSDSVSGTANVTVTAGQPANITILPSSTSVSSGQNQQFTATGNDANGNIVDIIPTWSSSNASVGNISSSGLFAAKKAGSAIISASHNGITGIENITVTPGNLSLVIISLSNTAIIEGQTQNLTANGYDANVNAVSIIPEWSSSNTTVGAISSSGLFTASSAGTTTIIAANGSVSGNVTVTVTVVTPTTTPTPTPTVTPTATPTPTPIPTINTGPDIVSRYAGSDGIVQRSEAVQAVIDYFGGVITKQEAVSVVMAYFGG